MSVAQPSVPSARSIAAVVLAGLAHLTAAEGIRVAVGLEPMLARDLTLGWFATVGGVLLGAVVGALLFWKRLVAPALVVLVVLSWAAFETWTHVASVRASGAALAATPLPLSLYLLLWPLVLGVACLAGAAEWFVRRPKDARTD